MGHNERGVPKKKIPIYVRVINYVYLPLRQNTNTTWLRGQVVGLTSIILTWQMSTSALKACRRATRSARNASTFPVDTSAAVDMVSGPTTVLWRLTVVRSGAVSTWMSVPAGEAVIAVRPALRAATRPARTTVCATRVTEATATK